MSYINILENCVHSVSGIKELYMCTKDNNDNDIVYPIEVKTVSGEMPDTVIATIDEGNETIQLNNTLYKYITINPKYAVFAEEDSTGRQGRTFDLNIEFSIPYINLETTNDIRYTVLNKNNKYELSKAFFFFKDNNDKFWITGFEIPFTLSEMDVDMKNANYYRLKYTSKSYIKTLRLQPTYFEPEPEEPTFPSSGDTLFYLSMENRDADYVYDSSPNNMKFANENRYATFTTGLIGDAIDFSNDARSNLWEYGTDSTEFTSAQPFSISLWFKLHNDPTRINTLFANTDYNTHDGGFELYLNSYTTNEWRFYYFGGDYSESIYLSKVINKDYKTWTHIVLTYDGSADANGVKFYIDGVLQSLNINTNNMVTNGLSTHQFYIGNHTDHNLEYSVEGLMDEFGFWLKELTPQEVSNLYNDGNGMPYPS